MAYYVLGTGGAKFGPVETGTLNAWIGQGRVGPETLIEDAGGVKSPARSIRGLSFVGLDQPGQTQLAPVPTIGDGLIGSGGGNPIMNAPGPQPAPVLGSSHSRPTLGTGGSQGNLFLPGTDSKWAWQGFACVAAALACSLVISFTHWWTFLYLGKILIFAFALPIFGAQRGYQGLRFNRPLALLIIALNVVALLGGTAMMFRGLFI